MSFKILVVVCAITCSMNAVRLEIKNNTRSVISIWPKEGSELKHIKSGTCEEVEVVSDENTMNLITSVYPTLIKIMKKEERKLELHELQTDSKY